MKEDTIEIKGVIWEDMVNYKKISMTLMMPTCDFKCDKENGVQICQNWGLAATASVTVRIEEVIEKYKANPITEAIVLQGLEPFDSPLNVYTVAAALNTHKIQDDLVIYTGYNREEITPSILTNLTRLVPGNLIIKWGRYIPNQQKHYDEVLGVYLASDNQYAEIIEKDGKSIKIQE